MKIKTRLCRFPIFALILLFSFAVHGKVLQSKYAPLTLHDYISSVCPKGAKCVEQESLLSAVHRAAKIHNLDFKKLLAIVRVESSFNVRAKNASSVGLAQVNLDYHRKKFKGSPYDIADNIMVAESIYYKCLIKHRQHEKKSLRCYNGENSKDFTYADKVLKAYAEISKLLDMRRDVSVLNARLDNFLSLPLL